MHENILSFFAIPGDHLKTEKFGSGLINDTYLCSYREGDEIRKYILQRINTTVFTRPGLVMENVEVVTRHIVNRLRSSGMADPSRSAPTLVFTRDNRSSYREASGAFWRMFHFIEAGTVYDAVVDARHAYEVGRGIGMFQALVADLPPETLHDTLPGFHHTPRYLSAYDDALRADEKGRASGIKPETAFVDRRRSLAPLLIDLMTSGGLPVRVVHNDPKVNNVMVRIDTHEALCMLDLDTVKPGIVHFDFGDCVRSAANPAGEDAPDPDSAQLALPLFEAIAEGYLRETGGFLTGKEIELLPLSVKVITFELGLRFLADYLRGDAYFRTNYPGHNLHRARVQFRLLETIEAAEERMTSFIQQLPRR